MTPTKSRRYHYQHCSKTGILGCIETLKLLVQSEKATLEKSTQGHFQLVIFLSAHMPRFFVNIF
jgi:hypothetical protein